MSKITKALIALSPLAFPALLILILLLVLNKYDNFGGRSDGPLFALALAFQALFTNYKVSKRPQGQIPSWLGLSWTGAVLALILATCSVVFYLLLELDLFNDSARSLSRMALLNLFALGLSFLAAFSAEFALA